MANFDFPIFDKKFCARVDKKDKNLIRRPLLTREKPLEKNGERYRGCGKIHTKNAFWAKYNDQKLHFGRKCNKESVEVSPKHIPKKCILGKIQWRKIAFGVRYNGEKVRKV
jgi:hypothetical protein